MSLGSLRAEIFDCDVSNSADIAVKMAEAVKTFGGFDVIVLNAGASHACYFEEVRRSVEWPSPDSFALSLGLVFLNVLFVTLLLSQRSVVSPSSVFICVSFFLVSLPSNFAWNHLNEDL